MYISIIKNFEAEKYKELDKTELTEDRFTEPKHCSDRLDIGRVSIGETSRKFECDFIKKNIL